MKFAMLMVALMALGCGKDKPKDPAGKLTELQMEKLKRTSAQLQVLRIKFESESGPVVAEQNAVILEVCKGIGVPEEKVAKECQVDLAKGTATWNKPAQTAKPADEKK